MLIGFLLFTDPQLGNLRSPAGDDRLLLIVILCNRFLPFVFFSRTKGEWLIHWTLFLRASYLSGDAGDDRAGFFQSVASLTKENTTEQPETSAEAVDALNRGRSGRGHHSGRRSRPDPIGRGVQRQDGARSNEAASGDVCGSHGHNGRAVHRDASHQTLLARSGV